VADLELLVLEKASLRLAACRARIAEMRGWQETDALESGDAIDEMDGQPLDALDAVLDKCAGFIKTRDHCDDTYDVGQQGFARQILRAIARALGVLS